VSDSFSITHTITSIPNIPFGTIASSVCGKTYTVSLVLIGDAKSRTLNHTYRNKDYATNVLAFPLSETSGEIFLNLRKAEREAKKFNHTVREHIIFLFIHGLLHLKGFTHGSRMEGEEKKYMRRFKNK